MVVKWSREIRRAIVTDNVQRAFQASCRNSTPEQICRGEVFKPLEDGVLQGAGRTPRNASAQAHVWHGARVTVPLVLQSRFEAVVQRQVNIDAISQYEPYELSQAMRTEALEAVKAMGGGKQYLNMPDFTDIVTTVSGRSSVTSPPNCPAGCHSRPGDIAGIITPAIHLHHPGDSPRVDYDRSQECLSQSCTLRKSLNDTRRHVNPPSS